MAMLSIVSLLSYFSEDKKSIKKGEKPLQIGPCGIIYLQSGYFTGRYPRKHEKQGVAKSRFYLDEENEIKSSECECPRGKFKCSHAAALFIHGIHNLSRTDNRVSVEETKIKHATVLEIC
ncbi:hypothetical protein OS493_002666 [Desmophyllum pertusum]|uniref:SWIM-type domain-containing protein n=1 Tax=Desmophyllum pertusum TaxID=174260 RepID=A0A9W9YTB2_9CNID|nr:hypothetical protein OS493_002666 [Desmophyllum pertusum]